MAEVVIKGKTYRTGDEVPGGGTLGEDGLVHAVYGRSPGGGDYVTSPVEAAKSTEKKTAATDDDTSAKQTREGLQGIGSIIGSYWDQVPLWGKIVGGAVLVKVVYNEVFG